MVYKYFDKKSKGGVTNNVIKKNLKLAKELHKPIIRNLEKRTVYSRFRYLRGWFSWYVINKQV